MSVEKDTFKNDKKSPLMLSIIISSYQPDYFQALEKNIAETIGIEYEIIKVDNPGIMGICEAYNNGASKARYDNLLFLHEDVLFQTRNWGIHLSQFIEQNNVGCVGVAGSNYVPNVPHKWWKNLGYHFNNVLHLSENKKIRAKDFTAQYQKVYSLDGVFIACTKEVYDRFLFSKELKSYHGYDIDFSLRISDKYQNYLINDLDIIHFSGGNANKEWFKEIIKTRRFYKIPKHQKIDKTIEVLQYRLFAENVYKYCDSKREAILLLIKYFSVKKMGLENMQLCLKFCSYIMQK